MWFKNLKRYILLDFFMMKKKNLPFAFILFYISTLWYIIYCVVTQKFSLKAHSSGGKDLYTLKGGHSL